MSSRQSFRAEEWADATLACGSVAFFALIAAAAIKLHEMGFTRIYGNPNLHGWWYLPISYLIVLGLQDTCFYFCHRCFHHPRIYRWTHRGHHRSRHPSPITSFALDPIETLQHGLVLLGIVLVLPLHPATLLAVLTTMSAWTVMNHLSPEQLPARFPHHWLGRWIIGPAHHSIHHRKQTVHFGLYFTWWDKVLNTQDNSYPALLRPLPLPTRSWPTG